MVMATISTEDPEFQSAIEACAAALGRMADYELNPTLNQRMHELGERKEYLSPEEHEELLALVDFTQKRTVEKLEAQTALSRLRAALPGLLSES
jgi:hypothetical protein